MLENADCTNSSAADGTKRKFSVRERVYLLLCAKIDAGEFSPGQKLPSSRELSARLGVARISVIKALERLADEERITISPKVGSFVKNRAETKSSSAGGKAAQKNPALCSYTPEKASLWQQAARMNVQDNCPFALNFYDAEILKKKSMGEIVARFTKNPRFSVSYAPPAGCLELRQVIAERLRHRRAMLVDPEQVVITSGLEQNLNLMILVLFDPSDLCLMENPCLPIFRQIFHAADVEIATFDKAAGMPKSFNVQKRPKAIFLQPSMPFPYTHVMPLERRKSILQKAQEIESWIIENDTGCEFQEKLQPSFYMLAQGTENAGRVIYFGSFNHTKYPAVRLGYMVFPPSLVDASIGAKRLADHDVDISHQLILAEEIKKGLWDTYLRRIKRVFNERRGVLSELIGSKLRKWGKVLAPEAGTHLVFIFHSKTDDCAEAKFLKQRFGIETMPLSPCFEGDAAPSSGLILGISGYCEESMRKAFDLLAEGLARSYDG